MCTFQRYNWKRTPRARMFPFFETLMRLIMGKDQIKLEDSQVRTFLLVHSFLCSYITIVIILTVLEQVISIFGTLKLCLWVTYWTCLFFNSVKFLSRILYQETEKIHSSQVSVFSKRPKILFTREWYEQYGWIGEATINQLVAGFIFKA